MINNTTRFKSTYLQHVFSLLWFEDGFDKADKFIRKVDKDFWSNENQFEFSYISLSIRQKREIACFWNVEVRAV